MNEEEIYKKIEAWHNDPNTKEELHEYLGMTWEEWKKFVEEDKNNEQRGGKVEPKIMMNKGWNIPDTIYKYFIFLVLFGCSPIPNFNIKSTTDEFSGNKYIYSENNRVMLNSYPNSKYKSFGEPILYLDYIYFDSNLYAIKLLYEGDDWIFGKYIEIKIDNNDTTTLNCEINDHEVFEELAGGINRVRIREICVSPVDKTLINNISSASEVKIRFGNIVGKLESPKQANLFLISLNKEKE